MTSRGGFGAISLFALLFGCDTFDAPIDERSGGRLVVPTDVRKPHVAARKPPPITGGTLLVTRLGALAVASDPERDAIVVADIAAGVILGTMPLEPGDEPGRLVEDTAGRVHVALRRGGAIVTVNPVTRTVLDRRAVCGAPRGLALSTADTLEIACADGKLVTLPTGAGGVIRTISLEPDLRDVLMNGSEIAVTRFKTAEVLRLDATGGVARRDRPSSVTGVRTVPVKPSRENDGFGSGETVTLVQPFRPLVAWRTLAGANGTAVMVHQRAVNAPIEVVEPTMNGSSYGGGGFSCSGIAQNAVTVMGPTGATANVTFAGAPLPVDATLLPDGKTLVVVHAGPPDTEAPRPFVVFDDDEGGGVSGGTGGAPAMSTLSLIDLPPAPNGPPSADGAVAPDPGCVGSQTTSLVDPAVAVAFNPARPWQVVVQTRQPSTLAIFDDIKQVFVPRTISFDDGTTLDTGFQLFHRDSGGGIACATCHAEGAEDGNVWRFTDVGARRTQALNVSLEGTAPFHWDGKLASVGALMSEVFVGRMGGIHESSSRLKGLENWLFAQQPPVPLRRADDAAVLRGKALFDAPSTQCKSCHSGAHFTDNATRNVGTSDIRLQVPTLVGIGYRAPFMHDGCADTLAARFDAACGGGERHGHTADLSAEQIGDLVAYLESLAGSVRTNSRVSRAFASRARRRASRWRARRSFS